MARESTRFEIILEPFGRWLVWDWRRDAPAVLNGLALIGLRGREARALCGLLNRAA